MSAGANKIGKGAAQKGSKGGALMMLLFSVTIFVSAALLFLVEPMVAKFVLPLFGSTPAVWTGSMMFFQAGLLVSYLYVHLTTTYLGARRQAIIHLVIVLIPLLVLPLAVPGPEWGPEDDSFPLLRLLALLLVAVGLPFFAISATNPLIQRWLADTDHPSARDPYFLYVASNAGSVIGLLGYPLLIEPSLRLNNQGVFWSIGYGLLIVLVFASAAMLWRSAPAVDAPSTKEGDEEAEPPGGAPNPPVAAGGGAPETGAPLAEPIAAGMTSAPTLLRRLRWIGLAFVPSSLMLGVTAFITTDITPIPLLWVLPLSLYLFSFVVVFSPTQRMPNLFHKAFVVAFPAVMVLLTLTILLDMRNPYWLLILLHLLGFFVVAMVLHGELARDRPPTRHLTEFYLWVAFGGVLGGVFNALIAPIAFDTVVEYPLAIVLACLFLPGVLLKRLVRRQEERRNDEEELAQRDPARVRRLVSLHLLMDVALAVALGFALWTLGYAIDEGTLDNLSASLNNLLSSETFNRALIWETAIGLAAGLCLYFAYTSGRAVRFGLGIAAVIVAVSYANGSEAFYEDRSFFGAYRVSGNEESHTLSVGTTNHGAQILGQNPPEPITYYHRTGPVGQLFDALPNEDVKSRAAMIGLGTGSMACYAEPGQRFTFYEVDPLIERIARDSNLFTYLRDCPGEPEVVLGDARLSLRDAGDGEFGVILADAFSSDAIPVHLLTREAIDLYLDKLQENGVLMFHISNRHLELEPVLGNLAQDAGLSCYAQYDAEAEGIPGKFVSHWVTMSRDDDDLGSVPSDPRWQPCETNDQAVWTDDFSNLLGTFEWN